MRTYGFCPTLNDELCRLNASTRWPRPIKLCTRRPTAVGSFPSGDSVIRSAHRDRANNPGKILGRYLRFGTLASRRPNNYKLV